MSDRERYKVVVNYDTKANVPEDISEYIYCVKCLQEWKERHSTVMSPRDYGRTQLGIRPDGNIQVVCTRHNCNVAVLKLSVAERTAADGPEVIERADTRKTSRG